MTSNEKLQQNHFGNHKALSTVWVDHLVRLEMDII